MPPYPKPISTGDEEKVFEDSDRQDGGAGRGCGVVDHVSGFPADGTGCGAGADGEAVAAAAAVGGAEGREDLDV